MPIKKIFFVGLVGFVVVSAVLFWFFFLREKGTLQSQKARNQPSMVAVSDDIPITEPSPAIDYSKILEKYRGKDVERAIMDKKLIALTFDGGGNADGIEKILKTLSKNSIRSTFFLTGKFVEKFPGAVEEIKKSGGEIANHTYSHKNFTQLNSEETAGEISQMKVTLEKTGVALAPFSRFPYGAYKEED